MVVSKIAHIFLLSLTLSSSALAQDVMPLEEKRVLYPKSRSGGISLSSRGFAINYHYGRLLSGYQKLVFDFELASIKHPKEQRIVNPFLDDAKSFVYGKINSFYIFRTGIGSENLLFDKAEKNGVEISFNYGIGSSLGILKPIYYDVIKFDGEFVVVSEKFDKDLHMPEYIYGKSGFTKGFSEINFIPGGYVKTGFAFDWSVDDKKIRSLEAGAILDIFPKKVPILADFGTNVNKQSFISFYARFSFGKKY